MRTSDNSGIFAAADSEYARRIRSSVNDINELIIGDGVSKYVLLSCYNNPKMNLEQITLHILPQLH